MDGNEPNLKSQCHLNDEGRAALNQYAEELYRRK